MNIAPRKSASRPASPQAPPPGSREGDPRLGRLRGGAASAEAPRQEEPEASASEAGAAAPFLHHRRDGVLPAVAVALSVRGVTLTGMGARSDRPPELHPCVSAFLGSLPVEHRERHTGRCGEAVVLSRYLSSAESARTGRKSGRELTDGEARKALKQARLTARHVREEGDPQHGAYAPPCRSCARLLEYFGVTAVDPGGAAEEDAAGEAP